MAASTAAIAPTMSLLLDFSAFARSVSAGSIRGPGGGSSVCCATGPSTLATCCTAGPLARSAGAGEGGAGSAGAASSTTTPSNNPAISFLIIPPPQRNPRQVPGLQRGHDPVLGAVALARTTRPVCPIGY